MHSTKTARLCYNKNDAPMNIVIHCCIMQFIERMLNLWIGNFNF